MAGTQNVTAVVDRKGYVYRGQTFSRGQIVELPRVHFDEAQRIRPPYLRKATEEDLDRLKKNGGTVIVLAEVKAPPAENVQAAEEAQATNPAPKKK